MLSNIRPLVCCYSSHWLVHFFLQIHTTIHSNVLDVKWENIYNSILSSKLKFSSCNCGHFVRTWGYSSCILMAIIRPKWGALPFLSEYKGRRLLLCHLSVSRGPQIESWNCIPLYVMRLLQSILQTGCLVYTQTLGNEQMQSWVRYYLIQQIADTFWTFNFEADNGIFLNLLILNLFNLGPNNLALPLHGDLPLSNNSST